MKLGDLPESCIASILCSTSAKDVARLSCVSRAFREASCSNMVWEALLRPHCTDMILANALDASPMSSTKKSISSYLLDGILLKDGTQSVWLDEATGGACRSVGARGMSICWGEDRRYWDWLNRPGSRFAEVAELKEVCWFDVRGQLECFLPSGSYTFSWRMALNVLDSRYNYNSWHTPVKFSLETTGNNVIQIERQLNHETQLERWNGRSPESEGPNSLGRELPRDVYYFGEFKVGEFVVEKESSSVEILYSMSETSGSWKGGLYLDGIVIRPCKARSKHQAQEIDSEKESSNMSTCDNDDNDGAHRRTSQLPPWARMFFANPAPRPPPSEGLFTPGLERFSRLLRGILRPPCSEMSCGNPWRDPPPAWP